MTMTEAPLQQETQVFESHLKEWRESHLGEYVLIKNTDVIGFFPSLLEAFDEGTKQFSLEEFFIKQVLPEDTINISLLGRHLRSSTHA